MHQRHYNTGGNQMNEVNQSHLTIIKDTKFNLVNASLRILLPLDAKYATHANVMANLLSDRLINKPSKKEMTQYFDALYGVKVSTRTYSLGALQVIEISLIGIHQKFVDENLHQLYYDLLMEILTTPLINTQTLKEAITNVRNELERIDEQPDVRALFSAFEMAGKGQIFGVNVFGELDRLDDISVESMTHFHQLCLTHFKKEIYFAGDIDEHEFNQKSLISHTVPHAVHRTTIKPQTQVERHEGNQTEIVQVYESAFDPYHEHYYAYLVFLAILGQSPNSLLFQNVREKHNLCYSIYASQLIYDGLFYIATSVAVNNETKALDLIAEQIEIIKKGEFDVEKAKIFLTNRLEGTTENLRQLLDFAFRNSQLGLDQSIKSVIESFRRVSKEDVVEVAKQIQQPFIYIYRGEENETH